MPSQLLELLPTVDDPAVLQPPPSDPYHLGVDVANLGRLAPDLHRNRPPLRIAGGIADQGPDVF
jgi:hypothetical protein